MADTPGGLPAVSGQKMLWYQSGEVSGGTPPEVGTLNPAVRYGPGDTDPGTVAYPSKTAKYQPGCCAK